MNHPKTNEDKGEDNRSVQLAVDFDAAVAAMGSALTILCQNEDRPFLRMLRRIEKTFSQGNVLLQEQEDGRSFKYDKKSDSIEFDPRVLNAVISAVETLPNDLWDEGERLNYNVLALILFMAHEAVHPSQGFTEFSTVNSIKKGVGYLALAQMDVTADFVAALVGAATIVGGNDDPMALVESLVLSYLVGAHVFPPDGKPHKIQRLLGLLLSVALLRAEIDGRLNVDMISPDWTASVPLLAFDVEESKVLNAMLLVEGSPLLIDGPMAMSRGLPERLWRAVDQGEPEAALACISQALVEYGIVAS